MSLPDLQDNTIKNTNVEKGLDTHAEAVEGIVNLPELSVDESQYVNDVKELINEEEDDYLDKDPYTSLINQGIVDDYEKLRESYGTIIEIIEGVSSEVYVPETSELISSHNFESIKELEDAIDSGIVNLEEYEMRDIDNLLKELEKLEQKASVQEITSYGLRTLDDFYEAVEIGVLDLSKYSMKEIDKLINSLEKDESLMLSEFDISIYGNESVKDESNELDEIDYESTQEDELWDEYWEEDAKLRNEGFIMSLIKFIKEFFEKLSNKD